MRIENLISFRLIKEVKKNKNIASSTIIVVSAISISIIFFIFSISIMNGYIYGLMKIAFEVKSFHVTFPAYYSFKDSNYVKNIVDEDDRVSYASLYRETKVLLSANAKTTGIAFFRIMPEDVFLKDHGFNNCIRLIDGKKSLEQNEIMISKKSAEKLRLKIGSSIYLTTMLLDKEDVVIKRLKVSGIFTTGYAEFDEQLAMIGNKTGDAIFKETLLYNVFIKLKDYKKAKEFSKSYISSGLHDMMDWYELNEYEIKALNFEKNVIIFVVSLVIILASLNILTTINIAIYEKEKVIGILKAIGFSNNRIFNIFIFYGVYLSLVAVFLGVTLGLLFMNFLNEILSAFSFFINSYNSFIYKISSLFNSSISQPEKIEFFSKEFYLDKIYTEISFLEIFFIALFAFIFSLLASLLPAKKASKINTIEVIKNG